MNQQIIELITDKYISSFGRKPEKLIYAPGRINLIGEHTDYNSGFVMPAAIDKGIYFAVGASINNSKVISIDLNDEVEFNVHSVKISEKRWVNYILGVIDQLNKKEYIIGSFYAVFSGDIPPGAGLSSSAALECGFIFALNKLFELGIDPESMAIMGQAAEHEFVGVQCGIMDQFACVYGQQNHFIKLDCKTLQKEYRSLDLGEYSLVLFDSKVSHTLIDSSYNDRRSICEEVVQLISKNKPTVVSLRDVQLSLLEAYEERLSSKSYKYAAYVIQENERVIQANSAIDANDLVRLGELLNETHKGLSENYEVSCPEIDYIHTETMRFSDVLGGRLMGGGFGGCTLNLLKTSSLNSISEQVKARYLVRFGIELGIYKVQLSDGVHLI